MSGPLDDVPNRYEQVIDQDNNYYDSSKVLGREVKLMRASLENPSYEEYWPDIDGLARKEGSTYEAMPSHTFSDIAVIHLLTTSTINRLRDLYPKGRFEVRRFRPNIVIESTSDNGNGKRIIIAQDTLLRIIGPCTRCVMTTLPQGDLPKDLGIWRTIAKYNQVNVGVYALVHRGGTIRSEILSDSRDRLLE